MPDQPSEAIQLVTSADDQERFDDWPNEMDNGEADIETVGVGGEGGEGAPEEFGMKTSVNDVWPCGRIAT